MMKRRRIQRTDYVQRLGLLKSGKPRLVLRRYLNNVRAQVIISEEPGDKTVVEVVSKNLRKYGWMGHGGNLPSAYLTGYLAGAKAMEKGIKEAVVDIGLHKSIRASGLYAAAMGARDAGMKINIGENALPSADRVSGNHTALYAEKIKNTEQYKRQFSGYLKNNFKPEDLPKHFEETKKKIKA